MDKNQILRYFDRDYRGTYPHVIFPDGEEHLMKITTVDSGSDSPSLFLQSPDIGQFRLNICSKHKLKFIYPKTGSFQLGKHGIFLIRDVENRNYYRGPCAENLRMLSCHEEVDVNFLSMAAAFEKKQFSFQQALELLKKDYLSAALNNNLVLSRSIKHPTGYSLSSRYGYIAEIDEGGSLSWCMGSVKKEVAECLMY